MGRAALQQLFGIGLASLQAFAKAGDDESRGGVQHGDVSLRTLDGSGEDAFEDAGVLSGFPTDEVFDLGGGKAELFRIELGVFELAAFDLADVIHAKAGKLIHAATIARAAMHHPGSFSSELDQNLAKGVRELGIKHTHQLVIGASGVQKWPEHVEDAALAFGGEQLASLGDGFEGRVIQRGKEEAQSGLFDACHDFFLGQVDLDAERLQHIGTACF